MTAKYTVAVNDQQRKDLEETLAGVQDGLAKAQAGAINKLLPKARTLFVRAVADEIALPQKEIRDRISIQKASVSREAEGTLTIRRKAIPLIDYGARQGNRGVTVLVRRGKGRQLLQGTFIATMPSGHTGVFERVRRGSGRVARLPLQQRFGPTVLGIVDGAPGLLQKQLDAIQDELPEQLASQVDRLLRRRKVDR